MAIPTKDASLLDWSGNASARLTGSPESYGTTAAVAAQYAALHDAFALAYGALVAARASGTRSESQTSLKEAARSALLDFARPLYAQIRANTAVTDPARIELGVAVSGGGRTRRPAPEVAPGLTVVSVDGRLVTIRLSDPAADPSRNRMPAGAGIIGATVMSFVGAERPDGVAGYKYEGGTSRMTMRVLFPEGVAPGTRVWLTAFFVDERMRNGPACAPVSTVINYGGSMPAAAAAA